MGSTTDTTPAADPMWVRHCEADTKTPVVGTVVGTIPAWLSGRLIRNGPGEKYIGTSHFNHLFDGMSILHMVNIEEGRVTYTSRFLESESYKINHRANRIVVSEFGTTGVPDPCLSLYSKFTSWFQPGIAKTFSDNCLVNVLQVKDELLAMTETDTVRIVDPATLETKPEMLQYKQYVTCQRVTAHPHVAEDNTVYNLGFITGKGPLRYAIVSLKDGKIQNSKVETSVESRWKLNPGYMHSFGLTENYYILVETPAAFDVTKLFLPVFAGFNSFKAMKYHKNEPTRFRILSRKTGEEVTTTYLSPGFFNFHFYNCYEIGGNIVVDLCATTDNMIDYLTMENLKREENDPKRSVVNSEPWRFVIPVDSVDAAPVGEELLKNVDDAKISRDDYLASASAVKRTSTEIYLKPVILSETFAELPRINYKYNTKPYTYGYSVSIKNYKKSLIDFDSLAKLNVRTGEEKVWEDTDYFCSEPVFVATPGGEKEDDGVILTILIHKNNPRQLAFLVLDASTMQEMARVNFTANGAVTPTFHGQFIAADKETHSY